MTQHPPAAGTAGGYGHRPEPQLRELGVWGCQTNCAPQPLCLFDQEMALSVALQASCCGAASGVTHVEPLILADPRHPSRRAPPCNSRSQGGKKYSCSCCPRLSFIPLQCPRARNPSHPLHLSFFLEGCSNTELLPGECRRGSSPRVREGGEGLDASVGTLHECKTKASRTPGPSHRAIMMNP